MKIQLTDEWSISADSSCWVLAFQSSEISEKTGKRVSTIDSTFHGNLEQALKAYVDETLKLKISKAESKRLLDVPKDLISHLEQINIQIHNKLDQLKQGGQPLEKLPRITD